MAAVTVVLTRGVIASHCEVIAVPAKANQPKMGVAASGHRIARTTAAGLMDWRPLI